MSNRTWVWIVVVALVALAAWAFLKNKSSYTYTPTISPTVSASHSQGSAHSTSKSSPGSAAQAQTYSQLVEQYKGYRIQFDEACQASPTNASFKNGQSVMFDNRSASAKTIKIGSLSYSFQPYGYKILTLSSQTLPKTLSLSCGTSVNVGQIMLEK
jgi:hypothetical protein